MSTPVPTRPSSSTQQSRQQLDELDALLQRMLALPVNRLEEDTTEPAANAATSSSSLEAFADGTEVHEPSALATLVAVPATKETEFRPSPDFALEEEPPWHDEPVNPGPAFERQEEFAETAAASSSAETDESAAPLAWTEETDPAWAENKEERADEENAALEHAFDFVPNEEDEPARDEFLTPAQAPRVTRPPIALWLRPLVFGNDVFELGTSYLGEPGRWLRSQLGRNLLAWVGMFCLATAAALALRDWFGWTW